MSDPAEKCRCGHYAAAHPKPRRLIAWLWTFEYLFIRRPCLATFDKPHGLVKCACPGWRPQ